MSVANVRFFITELEKDIKNKDPYVLPKTLSF